jgi:peptidoglycan hydrolase-like protein with peptidoglycan-binding domain
MFDKIADAISNVIDYFMAGRISELEEKTVMEDRVLMLDCDGEDVRSLQKDLVALGYDLGKYGPDGDGADGGFGTLTDTAVRHFQEANSLLEDGKVGPITRSKISDMVTRLGGNTPTEVKWKWLYGNELVRANKYEAELYNLQKKYDSLVKGIVDLAKEYDEEEFINE